MTKPTSAYPEKTFPADANGQRPPTTRSSSVDLGGKHHGVDFRHLWHTVLEKLWIIVLCILAGLFLGLGYLARTPNQYQGHIVLEVDVQETSVMGNPDTSSRMRTMFLASQDAMRTIEQNLTNRLLLARVIRSEGLAADGGLALLGEAGDKSATKSAPSPSPAPVASPAHGAEIQQSFTPVEEALAGYLARNVKTSIRRGTRLIDLFVTNRDPALAQRLTEAVAREYIRYAIERRTASNQETLQYLFEEEERLKRNLQKSEAAVAEYKAKTPDALQLGGGAAATGSQVGAGSTVSRGGLVEDKLQELTSKLMTAKAERLQLEGELKQVEESAGNVEKLLAFPRIAANAAVAERRRELADIQAQVGALGQRYKDKHPKMMAAKAALNEIQSNLRNVVLAQPAVLRNAIEQARALESNLTAAVHDQETSALALNKAAIGYQELARQAETDRALYESVLRQIKETNLTKDVKTNAVAIVEHSPLPQRPVSPSPIKAVGLGLLLGFCAAFGFVSISGAMDRSLKTVDQAESALGLPVLSAVPEVTKGDSEAQSGPIRDTGGGSSYRLVAEAPEGPAAEAFRNLRASLSLLGPEVDRKVFIFTSASPEEGKSFTSANYALSLAQQGHNVLLIDGDLRRPTLHKIFQPANSNRKDVKTKDVLGIVDYLVGGATIEAAIRAVSSTRLDDIVYSGASDEDEIQVAGSGKLWLMAGGRRAPNPAELLSGPGFAKLISEAREKFDRVIIDSAPILAVSDTLIMTPHVQSVCLVVRASRTPRNAVHRSLALLAGGGARPVGIVLNRLPRRRGAGYYYYYAAHGYGKGEGSYSGHYRPTIIENAEAETNGASDVGSKRRSEVESKRA